tara:strand:+ start:3887 stop:5236 length:1350 start_codon:yes stop_codon:yes gene_type:complete
MIKLFKLFILINLIFYLSSCSFKNTGVFFNDRLKELEDEIAKKNSKLVFSKRKMFREEIAGEIKKNILPPLSNENWTGKYFAPSNYIPHLKYENQKELFYKSKKLGKNKFGILGSVFEPILLKENIFFYDSSGNIYNFSMNQHDLVWKFNFYKKRYSGMPIKINLKASNENLIASDNLGYLYSLKINSGKLNWAKNYGIPFRSNIKTDDANIFLLNQDNKYYSVRKIDGKINLNLETFPSFLKSEKETNISLDIVKKNIYFITSTGELYSMNYVTQNINWLSTLFISNKDKGSDIFFSSPIVYKDDKLFFSSSVSTYSINSRNGTVNWELPFSSNLMPIVLDNFVFIASKDGFFLNIDAKTGKVIWSKNLFKDNKKIKHEKIGDIISLLLVSNQILATTSKGYFFFINYQNGNILNYTKASKSGFFSKPSLVDKKIYILDKNMRILVFR